MIWCFILPCIFLTSLAPHEIDEIAFADLRSELSASSPREIKIRGFLYRQGDGEWLLSSEPNLKSCCMGNADKADRQILVKGEIPENSPSPITVMGTLVVKEGRFQLQNSALIKVQEATLPLGSLLLGAANLCLALWFYKFSCWKRDP